MTHLLQVDELESAKKVICKMLYFSATIYKKVLYSTFFLICFRTNGRKVIGAVHDALGTAFLISP